MGIISWNDLLASTSPPPYRMPGTSPGVSQWATLVDRREAEVKAKVHELAREEPSGGAYVCFVDGRNCNTEDALFQEWSEALGFPGYFGHNWDAFDECLSDLLILDDGGIGAEYGGTKGEPAVVALVLVTESDKLLIDEPEKSLRTLLKILEQIATGLRWADDINNHTVAALRIIFQCDPLEVERVRERYERAGLGLSEAENTTKE